MKKIKAFICIFPLVFVFIFGCSKALAAEPDISIQIRNEVDSYVASGKLEDWHSTFVDNEGYQAYYWKMVHLSNNLEYLSTQSRLEILSICTWYDNDRTETWNYIIENLDIEPQYLEQNKILGLYWDSRFNNLSDTGYLYLIWTSKYIPSEFMVIKELTVNGKTYQMYDSEEDKDKLQSNWQTGDYYHYVNSDLTLHITPIAGYERGEKFGIPLTQRYSFTKLVVGLDEAQWETSSSEYKMFDATIEHNVNFDLGLTPKQDGKNAMQLVTHAYEIIKECEVQSYFDLLQYGGYGHFAYFNTTIPIDKIYRVDVAYKVTNDNANWFQSIFLPNNEHQITKSLTSQRVSGGIFGLYNHQGFKEGSFKSTKDDSVNYKYRLHLNYNDDSWNIFEGKEYYESDYKRVSNFQILRLNYLADGEVFDVPIKMDTIEGDTLFILDPNLILDTDSTYYKLKKDLDDLIANVKQKLKESKNILLIIVGCIGGLILISIGYRLFRLIRKIFIVDKDDDKCKHKRM